MQCRLRFAVWITEELDTVIVICMIVVVGISELDKVLLDGFVMQISELDKMVLLGSLVV